MNTESVDISVTPANPTDCLFSASFTIPYICLFCENTMLYCKANSIIKANVLFILIFYKVSFTLHRQDNYIIITQQYTPSDYNNKIIPCIITHNIKQSLS